MQFPVRNSQQYIARNNIWCSFWYSRFYLDQCFELCKRLAFRASTSWSRAKDSLFHSSISAMLRHYGVSSAGLSGLAPIKYYTGSHAVMAGLSGLADVAPIAIYPAGQQIFFEPALIFSIAYCVTVFSNDYDSMNKFAAPMMAISFILVSSAAVWNSFLASESYCLSLVILFLCAPHLFSPLRRPCAQKALRLSRWLLICVLYLAALLLIKISVAIVLAILVGLVGGVIILDRRPILFTIICVSGLLIFIMVIVAASYIIRSVNVFLSTSSFIFSKTISAGMYRGADRRSFWRRRADARSSINGLLQTSGCHCSLEHGCFR